MAEIVAGFLGAAIEVVKWIGAPIMRQFNYLCCFTTNINNLKHEAEELDVAARGIQMQVDRALDDVQDIIPQVENWLAKSEKIKDTKAEILAQVPNVGSGCSKLRARFSLSKRAKKTADRIKELRGECKFSLVPETAISLPGPPAAREAIPLGKTYEFESRKQIEEDTMAALKSGDVSMIGICGMGGLGKTTMAKRIMNRVLKEHAFEEAVMAVVSQQVDKSKIQCEIAGSLGLKLESETSEAAIVKKLHARLSGTKRILLVLDDVWQRLVLEDLGIHCDSKGCTILLTSRNRDALHGMNVQKIFGMEVLSEEEAWFLFRETAGTCVDNTKLNYIAKEVVKECTGLPIALTVVGAALKDEEDVGIWEDALRQLKQCDPDIPDFIAEVYNPLKLSYDFLVSTKHAKSLFLLCCLFPEDADISLEMLTYFCMGLSIFEGIGNLEQARNRMRALIKMLKSRSLLLDGRHEDYVRMHDVVRDVCTFIAKQEKYIVGNDCTWMSSCQFPAAGLGFPNARLLFLIGSYNSAKEEFKLDDAFLEGIRDLSVLCVQGYSSLASMPRATQSLRNLNTLFLHSCEKLNSISVVGGLPNLEILICISCTSIEELPQEMKGLNSLKILELEDCRNLQRIGRDIISGLVGLEELKMRWSFKKWEAEDSEERENAGLRELEALTNLRWLEIDIEDPALAAEKMHLSSKIDKFVIRLGAGLNFLKFKYNKKLHLQLEAEICLGHWIEKQFLRDTEYLYLCGNGANNVRLTESQNLRWLELRKCKSMKNIDNGTVFPSIERLDLSSLPELQEIWDGPISSTSFNNLKTLKLRDLAALEQLWKSSSQNSNYVQPLFTNLSSIDIRSCPRLRNLGQLSFLPQLEELEIWECEMMEQVFLWNGEDVKENNSESRNSHMIKKVFAKLKFLQLVSLPSLTTFYQGIEGIEFPLLEKLRIKRCPKMKFITTNENSGGTSSSAAIDDNYAHLFCQPQKVSFTSNLKELQVEWNPFCGHKIPLSPFNGLEKLTFTRLYGNMSLLVSSVAENLVNLRVLKMTKCGEMLKVVEAEKKLVSGGKRNILFPKLEELQLKYLPKLVSFCGLKCDVEMPSLKDVLIRRCPDMESFSLGFLAAPNLEYFKTDLENNLEIGDKVSFNRMILEIMENENPLHGHKMFISPFHGLKELSVFVHLGSMCLFTSSIARNLVSLEVLTISSCDEMVKVVEDEEEDEEEKVVSGGERAPLFPKLQELYLKYLPKLVSFCEWKRDVELPSLRKVEISECPNMEKFTMGFISAPNLEYFSIDYNEIDGTKDLNGALQEAYLARAKEEGGEEEEEESGEEI